MTSLFHASSNWGQQPFLHATILWLRMFCIYKRWMFRSWCIAEHHSILQSCINAHVISVTKYSTARPVARGGGVQGVHPPQKKSGKRSTFCHKVGQKWGFCRRVEGGEVQKVHFVGPKGPLLGGSAPPQIRSWLRACQLLPCWYSDGLYNRYLIT